MLRATSCHQRAPHLHSLARFGLFKNRLRLLADRMMKRNYYNSPPAADAISGETDGTSVGASRGAGTDSATQPKTRASRGKARARNAAKDGGGPAGELAERT